MTPRRIPTPLHGSLEKEVLAYATAAGAAGVSLLALTEPAQAKIIYTPTHQTITQNSKFNLDLNGDGITDFVVSNLSSDFDAIRATSGSPFTFALLRVYPQGNPTAFGAPMASNPHSRRE
jgi:hypothetical protein